VALLAGAVVLVGAAVTVVVWLLWGRAVEDAASAAPVLSQAKADAMALVLSDPDPTRAAAALSAEAAAVYLAAPGPLVPAGSTLTLDAATFTQTGEADAVVGATVSGAQTSDLLLFLGLEDGEWHLIASVTA
jgi:hypothetical protein